jgi:hypothetical protein
MTVNELTNFIWYVQEIIIVESVPSLDIDELRTKALFVGDNAELRSDNYKDIKNRYIQSFGAVEDFVVVTLKK